MEFIKNNLPLLTQYGVKLISALVILIVGMWLVKRIIKIVDPMLKKHSVDTSLRTFIESIISVALKVFVVVTALGQLGVETTSFVAIIGAAGLAVGLALQGSLANFAGGALILFFKPFRIGDLIEAQGYLGTVKEIQIFVTKLLTPENKTIIIPNGELSNGNIINYSQEGKLRVDLVVGISYDADIKKTKKVVLEVLERNSKILKDPAPQVTVSELADSSVNLAIRPWCSVVDYWDVYFGVLEEIKYAFDEQGIGIPYPHQVVHIYNKNDA